MNKTETPIIDLHCDLLSFLTHKPERSFKDPVCRCSYPQMVQGHVKLQTLAIFAQTGQHSVEEGTRQVASYHHLSTKYPMYFTSTRDLPKLDTQTIYLIPALENASTFAKETEPLNVALERLESYQQKMGPIFYITMTWNEENRFGGGNMTTVGLKEDGEHLLKWLNGKSIAIDLSHTSDQLAYGLIDFIDRHGLDIPLMASHSNFRAVCNCPRNLPDEIAKEIIHRQGLIGLNLFAPFIHPSDPSAIVRHLEYGLSLGGENALGFGADFFCDADFPSLLRKYQIEHAFYPDFSDSSAYPSLLELFVKKLKLSEEQLLKITSQNAWHFLKRTTFSKSIKNALASEI
jgi:membrane dipeptidase